MGSKRKNVDLSETEAKKPKQGNVDAQAVIPTIQGLLDCPICFQTMGSPIYQCQNGHIICNTCINKLIYCGECRVTLWAKIRCLALEKICKDIPIACRNENRGCMISTTVEKLGAHLQVCLFKPKPEVTPKNPNLPTVDSERNAGGAVAGQAGQTGQGQDAQRPLAIQQLRETLKAPATRGQRLRVMQIFRSNPTLYIAFHRWQQLHRQRQGQQGSQ